MHSCLALHTWWSSGLPTYLYEVHTVHTPYCISGQKQAINEYAWQCVNKYVPTLYYSEPHMQLLTASNANKWGFGGG